jgi:hypothetical protein
MQKEEAIPNFGTARESQSPDFPQKNLFTSIPTEIKDNNQSYQICAGRDLNIVKRRETIALSQITPIICIDSVSSSRNSSQSATY